MPRLPNPRPATQRLPTTAPLTHATGAARLFALLIVGVACVTSTTIRAEAVDPGEGTRRWLGPNIWPNPMQDWSVKDGDIVALAGRDRTAHALGFRVTPESLAGPMHITVAIHADPAVTRAGLRLGIQSPIDDPRAALLAHGVGIDAAIEVTSNTSTTLHLGNASQPADLDPNAGPIRLTLELTPGDTTEGVTVRLMATDANDRSASLLAIFNADTLRGNIALLAQSAFVGPPTAEAIDTRPRVRFNNWTIDGDHLTRDPEAAFGPILWSQYTLSDGRLTVSAQMPPLGEADPDTVAFQVADGPDWQTLAHSRIDPDARVAVFRIDQWRHERPTDARLVYRWQGEPHAWAMTIRPEPAPDRPLSVAVFSCDHGYAFPHAPLVADVLQRDPDVVFFAGDQIYEHVGGFGTARTQPVDFAILDYLRKYAQFGWTWREVLRDRPSVVIPDDHDVYHGNVWGAGGRLLQPGERPVQGGYLMPTRFVNAVQMTQTASLPPPFDPTPTPSGIGVYYTAFRYGPLDLAVVEDRKWKTGPGQIDGPIYERSALQDAELLGRRQEAFLERWLEREAPFKVVLSQTMFAKPATHQGWQLKPQPRDPDCNGWPMPARDRALKLLGPDVVMLAGDQHLGMLARLGVETWDDGPLAFMAPGTANGHPRAWLPDTTAAGEPAKPRGHTGRYIDGLGGRLDVLGVANPQPGSNELRTHNTHPHTLARLKGSGWGLATFDPATGRITFDMIRTPGRSNDDDDNTPGVDSFPGFPITPPR